MGRDSEAKAREAGLDDQLSALDLAGIYAMRDPSAYGFPKFQGSSFASASGDDTNAMPQMSDMSICKPSIELCGSRMIFAPPPELDRDTLPAAWESPGSFHLADFDSNSPTASKNLARATLPVGVNGSRKDDNATSFQWIGSPESNPVSPVSPTEAGVARWRLSNPPDSLLIPQHLQLEGDSTPLIAPTTSSIVSSSSDVGSSYAFSLSSTEQCSSDMMYTSENDINGHRSHAICGGPWGCHTGSTRTQVGELRDLVKVVNNEWMHRLTLTSDLHHRCAAYSSPELFVEGFKTVEKCLCGNIPRDFMEVFALMHVAFAAAYILHRDDGSCRWSTFFQDALCWKFSLTGQDDQADFLAVMDLWWQPELSFETLSITNVGPASGYIETQQDLADCFPIRVMDKLRNGGIIRNCVEFLNGMSYPILPFPYSLPDQKGSL